MDLRSRAVCSLVGHILVNIARSMVVVKRNIGHLFLLASKSRSYFWAPTLCIPLYYLIITLSQCLSGIKYLRSARDPVQRQMAIERCAAAAAAEAPARAASPPPVRVLTLDHGEHHDSTLYRSVKKYQEYDH